MVNNSCYFNDIEKYLDLTLNQDIKQSKIKLDDLLSFLNKLLNKNIPYYYIENGMDSLFDDVKNKKYKRCWYFYLFSPDITDNDIIEMLLVAGCNCIDLINICRIKFNLYPVYKHVINPSCIGKFDNNIISQFFGSYKIWYNYFNNDKYKINHILIKQLLNNNINNLFSPGTLLLSPYSYNRNHAAIIIENDNIIHSYPQDNKNDFEKPGIVKESLFDVIKLWQQYFHGKPFYFSLAIPFNDWMINENLIDKTNNKFKSNIDYDDIVDQYITN